MIESMQTLDTVMMWLQEQGSWTLSVRLYFYLCSARVILN